MAEPLAPVNSGITDPLLYIFVGLEEGFIVHTAGANGSTCSSYTNNTGGRSTVDGTAAGTDFFVTPDSFFQSGESLGCNTPHHIVCVEQ